VTGLAANGSTYLYVSSTAQNTAYRYYAPGVTSRSTYMSFTASSNTRDMAIDTEGGIWVALDWSSVSLRHYDASGSMTDIIGTDLVPDAYGVTLDDSGILWVSDTENNLIYAVNTSTGVEDGDAAANGSGLSVSANPFGGSVTLSSPGGSGTLSLYDCSGRLVLKRPFDGSHTVEGGRLSAGTYLAAVRSGDGALATARLVKL
jgi:sugar lactone lactonase YvrE